MTATATDTLALSWSGGKDSALALRALPQLLEDLPADVDPCCENGEFHTFVHAGPIFHAPIACQTGKVVERDRFVFCDLLPTRGAPVPGVAPGAAR